MLFVLNDSDQAPEHQGELRRWLFANGVSYTELTAPVLVDSVARTLTVRRFVPVSGQESLDYPELVLDAHGAPVTVEHVLDLAVMPLSWMFTKRGAWTRRGPAHAEQSSIAR